MELSFALGNIHGEATSSISPFGTNTADQVAFFGSKSKDSTFALCMSL